MFLFEINERISQNIITLKASYSRIQLFEEKKKSRKCIIFNKVKLCIAFYAF